MATDMQSLAHSFRILGALFYQNPRDSGMESLRDYLAQGNLHEEWPWGPVEELRRISPLFCEAIELNDLAAEHQRLFDGPNALPAPPWGSVYLDKENCLFGDSTMALVDFCSRHGIAPVREYREYREPPDNFGLICSMLALVAETGNEELTKALFVEHLLPWGPRFLALFTEACRENSFYRACGQLAALSLEAVRLHWAIDPPSIELHY